MARILRSQDFPIAAVDLGIKTLMALGASVSGVLCVIDRIMAKSTATLANACVRAIRDTIMKLYQVIENLSSFL